MRSWRNVIGFFLIGITAIFGFYYYLDNVYFAPNAAFKIVGEKAAPTKSKEEDFDQIKGEGKRYYSFNRHHMAIVSEKSVKIYTADSKNVIDVELNGKEVSFFEWMPDRNLGIVALYGGDSPNTIVLEQFNPEAPDHKQDTKLKDMPSNSRIVDVVYSTATNAVYMKVKVGTNAYRIYRTDANYDTRRIYAQATNIGRIATFYDEDKFIYDNQRTGTVYVFTDKTGGWRVISPAGRYYFVGVDKDKNIYIAKVNRDGKALEVSEGKLGVGFKELYKYKEPKPMAEITVQSIKKEVAECEAAESENKGE